MTGSTQQWTKAELEKRWVAYADLKPCFNAFIDTRTPGSEAKENFTIIGPGVSENPEQHVHIQEPHGFNIGGARQPPSCINSQHSHDTAEVFVVHQGRWRFDLGEHGEDAQVILEKGDVISIPTNIFRGFTNVGEDVGFLWAVLGEDNPGRVMWAPRVFEMAENYGLVLLETGALVDTTKGETVPHGARPMQATSAEDASKVRRVTPDEAQRLVWRNGTDVRKSQTSEQIIGPKGHFIWPHGFTLDRIILGADEATRSETCENARVIFIQSGSVMLNCPGTNLLLETGDTMSIPHDLPHAIKANQPSDIFSVQKAAT